MLNASEITRVFDSTLKCEISSQGFKLQKPRHWIRVDKTPIHEFVWLVSGRSTYTVTWGVGLTFVPDVSLGKEIRLKYNRTEKSSRPDFDIGVMFIGNIPWKYQISTMSLPKLDTRSSWFGLKKEKRKLATVADVSLVAKEGAVAALSAFESIQSTSDVISSVRKHYCKRPEILPCLYNYWLSLGLCEVAVGNEIQGFQMIDKFENDREEPVNQNDLHKFIEEARKIRGTLS